MSRNLTLQQRPTPAIPGQSRAQVERQHAEAPALPACSAESVQCAKAAQRAERAEVTRLTGLRFTEDGRLTPFALVEDVELGLRLANYIWLAVNQPSKALRSSCPPRYRPTSTRFQFVV